MKDREAQAQTQGSGHPIVQPAPKMWVSAPVEVGWRRPGASHRVDGVMVTNDRAAHEGTISFIQCSYDAESANIVTCQEVCKRPPLL